MMNANQVAVSDEEQEVVDWFCAECENDESEKSVRYSQILSFSEM